MLDNIRTDWLAVVLIILFCAWLLRMDNQRKQAAAKEHEARVHERIAEYKKEPPEPPLHTHAPTAPPEWVTEGSELYERLLASRLEYERRRNHPSAADSPHYLTLWRDGGRKEGGEA